MPDFSLKERGGADNPGFLWVRFRFSFMEPVNNRSQILLLCAQGNTPPYPPTTHHSSLFFPQAIHEVLLSTFPEPETAKIIASTLGSSATD